MADTNLSDDDVKLVRFVLLTVKREDERILESGDILVTENLDGSGFDAWIIGKYVRKYDIRQEDHKYLRVYFEVLERYSKEPFRHEQKQVRVLEEIRDAIRDKGERPVVVHTQAPPPPAGAAGATGATGTVGTAGTTP